MRLRRGKTWKAPRSSPASGTTSIDDVHQRADRAAHQDDQQPVGVRPAPHEVQDRDGLQQDAVRIEEPEHAGAATIAKRLGRVRPWPPCPLAGPDANSDMFTLRQHDRARRPA